jgi:putative adhesin
MLRNLGFEIHPWLILAKYWPLLIIFWGLSKLVNYFRSAEDPSAAGRSLVTGGDIVLLLFLLVVGSTVTKLVSLRFLNFPDIFSFPTDEPFGILSDSRKSFTYVEEQSQLLTKQDSTLEVRNEYGNVDVRTHDLPELKIRLEKKIKDDDESKAREMADLLKVKLEARSPGYLVSTNRDQLGERSSESVQTNLAIWVPKATRVLVFNKYGSLSLDGVAGSHTLTNGYGSIKACNIDGSLHAGNQNGSVNVTGVTGDCDISSKYGSVELDTIGGKIKIDAGYGSVILRKIKGPVQLAHKYGSVECEDLDGALSVDGRYAEVKGVNIGGDVQITTSYKNVDLDNIQGAMTIRGKHGDINVKSDIPPSKPIKIDSEYSAVKITLPAQSRFRVEAYSKFGKFVSGFDSISNVDFSPESVGDTRARGSHGEGGPLIVVNTSYRDINLIAS